MIFFTYSMIMLMVLALSLCAFHKSAVKNADLLLTTILLMSNVLLCTLLTTKFGLLNIALISPLLDFPLAVLVYQMWLRRRQQWKLIVVASLISQLTLHINLIIAWADNILTPADLSLYVMEINIILVVILTTLGWVGFTSSMEKHE